VSLPSPAARPWVPRVSPATYVEVLAFYAFQMPLLEERRFDEFATTFTEDGVYAHAKDGWELRGREQLVLEMRRNVPHYGTTVFRHWFDKMVIEERGSDTVEVSYRALVSLTDESGGVSFEPSSTIVDTLVRRDGALHTASRVVTHDIPDPADYWADRLAQESPAGAGPVRG